MKGTRPTISEVVVDLLTRNHAVHQHIRMGLINYHALAASIKPTVDRVTRRDVNVNTIVVIIKRFSDAQSKLDPRHDLGGVVDCSAESRLEPGSKNPVCKCRVCSERPSRGTA